MFKSEILTSEADVEALEGEWRHLQQSVGRTPFTNYDWFKAWWDNLGKSRGRTLHIVTGRIDQQLVAILPLAVLHKKGLRVLQNIGKESLFPCDILSESMEHTKTLWETARQSPLYDFSLIGDVEAGSDGDQILAGFSKRVKSEKFLILRSSWSNGDAWMASLPSKLQREYRRWQRRLQEKGELQYHIHTEGPLPTKIIDDMIRHKKDWCLQNGLHGFFDRDGAKAFFHQWIENAYASKQLFLAWLQCGDETIAYNLGFFDEKIFYGYLVANDPAWASFSPGTLAIMNSIRWAIDNEFREFNFMQGDATHKHRYTDDARDYAEWSFSHSLKGRLLQNLYLITYRTKQRLKDARKKQHVVPKPAAKPETDSAG